MNIVTIQHTNNVTHPLIAWRSLTVLYDAKNVNICIEIILTIARHTKTKLVTNTASSLISIFS